MDARRNQAPQLLLSTPSRAFSALLRHGGNLNKRKRVALAKRRLKKRKTKARTAAAR
jgi:hypothetical protein